MLARLSSSLHFQMGKCSARRSPKMSYVQTELALPRIIEDLPPALQHLTLDEIPDKNVEKYYHQRYDLFSLYDEGVVLDYESWFSVTPEVIARDTARRMACHTIVDGCCGAGGNAIQFAQTCQRVIAIDINPLRIQIARHNASIYGVDHLIEFICGNSVDVLPSLKNGSVDAVFLSPPWGGPDYKSKQVYDLQPFLKFTDAARCLTPNVAVMFPRTIDTESVTALFGPCQFVHSHVRNKTKAIMAYFGNLQIPLEPNSPPRTSTESIEFSSPDLPAQKKMRTFSPWESLSSVSE